MNAERPGEDTVVRVTEGLKVLSVETRLRILMLLRSRSLCVGALACRLGLTQGAVSQHLKILREAGFVAANRQGYYVHYRVNEEALARWHAHLDGLLALPTLPNDASKGRVVSPASDRPQGGKRYGTNDQGHGQEGRVEPCH